jgi:hypothetical protein
VCEVLGGRGDGPGAACPAANRDNGRQSGSNVPDPSEVRGVASTDYSWVGFDVDDRRPHDCKKRVGDGLIIFDIHRRIDFASSVVAGVKWSKRQSREGSWKLSHRRDHITREMAGDQQSKRRR